MITQKKLIAAFAALILVTLTVIVGAIVAAPAADASELGRAMRGKVVMAERYRDHNHDDQWHTTRSVLHYRAHANRLVFFRMTGRLNLDRDSCGQIETYRVQVTWSDGQRRRLHIPCRGDADVTGVRNIHVVIRAQSPCPVVPCPPASTLDIQHRIHAYPGGNYTRTRGYFVA